MRTVGLVSSDWVSTPIAGPVFTADLLALADDQRPAAVEDIHWER